MMRPTSGPPRLAQRLLEWSLPNDRHDDISGDLDEVFAKRCRSTGPSEARVWYWREATALALQFRLEGLRETRQRKRREASLPKAPTLRSRLRLGISWLDVKLGVRMLVKHPGLTIVSTAALAIAIAIVVGFNVATEFMVRPTLPVPDGDRVVAIWQHDTVSGDLSQPSLGDMLTWQRELEALDSVGGFRLGERAVNTAGAIRLVRAAEMTPSVFEMLRIPPEQGRPLIDADTQPGVSPVVVIGFDFWQAVLNGDRGIIGQTLRIGGVARTVVGIMPPGFAFPRREDIWLPLQVADAGVAPDAGPNIDFAVGRLAPGATIAEVETKLQVVAARLAAEYPSTHARLNPRIARYAGAFLAAREPELPVLMHAARTAIGIILLVVAVNVGTLIYARNAARLGEIAVRMALGASRRRIVLQMFLESLVLSALAAIVGVTFLLWPLNRFRTVFDEAIAQGDGLPYWFDVGFHRNAIWLVAGLTILSAILTGALPALKLTSNQVQSRLQRIQQGSSGLRFGRASTFVVVSQVALSVALLTVGGAQLQAFVNDWWSRDDVVDRRLLSAQLRWDLGPDAAEIQDLRQTLAQADARRELGRRVVSDLAVEGATFDSYQGIRFFLPDTAGARIESPATSFTYTAAVDQNYFDVLGSPIRAGRALSAGDYLESAAPVLVVNEAFVRAMLPMGDPVGQRVRQVNPRTSEPTGDWARIVGVVADTPQLEISQHGPTWVAHPAVYVPLPDTVAGVRMLVRTRVAPEQIVGQLQALAAAVAPTLILHRPLSLEADERFGLTLVGLYGLAVGFFVFAAILLSTTGVYAMMSFTATQRTREIGIRTALGAPSSRVVRAIFARAIKQLGAGTVLGLGLGYLGADGPLALSRGLFAEGPEVVIGVAAAIVLMGLVACGRPIRRALSVAPTVALRADS